MKCESCGKEIKKYKRIPLKENEKGSIVCMDCYYALMTEYVDLLEGQ
ncbi:MAG: hypothetical protein ACFFA1_07655 [Promethearchaeota archaeon]